MTMDRDPQQNEPDARPPGGDPAGGDPRWRGAWLILPALFVVLLGACIVTIFALGRAEAFATGGFWVLLLVTILAGLATGARNLVVELHSSVPFDLRNYRITASWRRLWWQRWHYGRPRDGRGPR
jgi:hypothetical protein